MDRMDEHFVGLEKAQEEFHQAFDVRMETMEDNLVVMKNDIDMSIIQIASLENDINTVWEDIRVLELLVDNSHLRLEKVEDRVDRCVSSAQSQTKLCMMNTWLMGLEIQRVQREWREGHEGLLRKFSTMGDIVDHKFIHMDEELECQNHSADDAVRARAKGPCLRGRTETTFTP